MVCELAALLASLYRYGDEFAQRTVVIVAVGVETEASTPNPVLQCWVAARSDC